MLRTPNLDDQIFADIVEEAVKSIPYVYPEWTDHNAHDPGITMLELFAWYKEMQQYHLNCSTQRAMDMYLKLLGMRRGDIAPARAVVALENLPGPLDVCAGDEMTMAGGTTFTFDGDGAFGRCRVERLILEAGARTDLSELVLKDHLAIRPFREAGAGLWLGIRRAEAQNVLRLWLEVSDEYPVARNPIDWEQKPGRALRFTDGEGREIPLMEDGTYALGTSGCVALDVSGCKQSDPLGEGTMLWLRMELPRTGCEEQPALCGVCCDFADVTQVKRLVAHRDARCEGRSIRLERQGLLERSGKCLLLARDEWGWREVTDVRQEGARVEAQADFELAKDGQDNVRAIFYEEWMAPYLSANGTGRSGFAWPVPLDGQAPDVRSLGVMALEPTRGGGRYAQWRYAPSLDALTPFDPCFSFDAEQSALVFGDNVRGQTAPQGADALLLTDYAVTLADQGRFPVKQELLLGDAPISARAVHFAEGRARESTDAVRARLMRRLKGVSRAVTPEDYAAIAKATPGLRVMQAGAIAGYDADTGRASASTVTVAVLPYSQGGQSRPDADFIGKVQAQLDAVRPVCTQVKVVAPLCIRLNVSVTVLAAAGAGDVQQAVRDSLSALLRSDEKRWLLGARIAQADVAGAIGSAEGVLGVKALTVTADSARAGRTAAGDILLPPHALPVLGALEVYR